MVILSVFTPTHWYSSSQVDGSRSLLAGWFSCYLDTCITGYSGPKAVCLQLLQYFPLKVISQSYLLLPQLRRNTSINSHNGLILKISQPPISRQFQGVVKYKSYQRALGQMVKNADNQSPFILQSKAIWLAYSWPPLKLPRKRGNLYKETIMTIYRGVPTELRKGKTEPRYYLQRVIL